MSIFTSSSRVAGGQPDAANSFDSNWLMAAIASAVLGQSFQFGWIRGLRAVVGRQFGQQIVLVQVVVKASDLEPIFFRQVGRIKKANRKNARGMQAEMECKFKCQTGVKNEILECFFTPQKR